jgi:hypothetical protein
VRASTGLIDQLPGGGVGNGEPFGNGGEHLNINLQSLAEPIQTQTGTFGSHSASEQLPTVEPSLMLISV